MAEEEEAASELKVEDKSGGQNYQEEIYKKPKCNVRIEEIAKPKKTRVLFTYDDYKHILPKRNITVVTEFLAEEFAEPPEKMQGILHTLIRKHKEVKCRKICKKEARKKHFSKINEKKRKNMLNIITDILKKYISKSYFSPKQIIMTNRLRRISNKVLKELCNIRDISVPDRDDTCIRATLLFAVSDFFAYCIDTIYYELQVKKVEDYEELQRQTEEASRVAIEDSKSVNKK